MNIKDCSRQGLTIRQAADELDCSYDATRVRAFRAGVKMVGEANLTYRQLVQNMKPSNAIEYLLDCLDALEAKRFPKFYEVDLTLKENRLLSSMLERPGVPLNVDMLMSQVCFDSPSDWPHIETVRTWIANIRRKVGDRYAVKTHNGMGYSATRIDV